MPRQRGYTQYDEPKSAALYAGLTQTGLRNLDKLIHQYDPQMSRSEFLERLARGLLIPERFEKVFFTTQKL